MTYVDIQPGQWVLAFQDHCAPFDRSMAEHLEMFVHRGGGWDMLRAHQIFQFSRADRVTAKTVWSAVRSMLEPDGFFEMKVHRRLVIATAQSEAAVIALRDSLFAIGVDTENRIEEEARRLVAKFSNEEETKALKKIHQCLPHIFGGAS